MIIMNTQEGLRIAFEEFEKGTFIKHREVETMHSENLPPTR